MFRRSIFSEFSIRFNDLIRRTKTNLTSPERPDSSFASLQSKHSLHIALHEVTMGVSSIPSKTTFSERLNINCFLNELHILNVNGR